MTAISSKLFFECAVCKNKIPPDVGYWNACNQIVCGSCSFKIGINSLEPDGLHPELILMIKEQFGAKTKERK